MGLIHLANPNYHPQPKPITKTGLPELCTMLLDYYGYTLDEDLLSKFMPLLSGTLDFFSNHYGDVSKSGSKLTIFPTQGGN